MMKKLCILFFLSFFFKLLPAQENKQLFQQFDRQDVIVPPTDPLEWNQFRQSLEEWRILTRQKLDYNRSYYTNPAFEWNNKSYSCYFLMLNDEIIFDKESGKYTPVKLLEYGKQFGGFDCIILWHAYPRIGVDQRNQFDFYRDLPGGLKALRGLVAFLHNNNIRVEIDYNPWDSGTRRTGKSDVDELVDMVLAIDADGIFLDTMNEASDELRRKLNRAKPGVVFDSEGTTPLQKIPDHQGSWGQWYKDSYIPGIIRNKCYEPRHQVRFVERWDHDHSDEIQMAWMNGCGIVVWENVFGSWNGWNEHDKSALRLMLPVLRRYNSIFTGDYWEPLILTSKEHVFANRWDSKSLSIWTLVNRNNKPVNGELMRVPFKKACRYFDLISGNEIIIQKSADSVILSASIENRSIGGFIEINQKVITPDFLDFLKEQNKSTESFDTGTYFTSHETILLKTKNTLFYKPGTWKGEMVELKPATNNQVREFLVRECGFYESQTDILLTSFFLHQKQAFDIKTQTGHFAIEITPVTNYEFHSFLAATKYHPPDTTNFLKHWVNGQIPEDLEDHPVVWISLEDARAYATWAGKRLPTEDEWQWAALGQKYIGYPWNGIPDSLHCNMGKTGSTTAVKAFPMGRSNSGCYDMCGNVFEWTESEYKDGRIRFCILKGGSYFKPAGSIWYTEGGPLPSHHSLKFLLMSPSIDRCATIGFRCVVDME